MSQNLQACCSECIDVYLTPNLFNNLVESIKDLSQPVIKNICAKLLYGMHVRPAKYQNTQDHIDYLVSMFEKLPPELNVIVPLLEDKLILECGFDFEQKRLENNPLYRDFLNQFYLSFKRYYWTVVPTIKKQHRERCRIIYARIGNYA
jgi:hypothetical protein